MKGQEEKELSYQIAAFLEFQYPKVVFRFDVAADLYLTQRQASIVKNKLKHKRGYHDLTILEPKGKYHGLLLELKKNKAEVFRQDGELKKKTNKKTGKCHNQEQKQHLDNMRKKGYFADYGFGFVDTVKKIKTYMDL
jgi:hypothetical protein